MKILWLSGNPSLYSQHRVGYNNGGWIGALESIVTQRSDIELAIAFFYNDDCFRVKINNTTYYPINLYDSKLKKIKHHLLYEFYDNIETKWIQKILVDFNPDIIHVWGTEISFGLIGKYTDIPVVIHLQGILNPYLNTFFGSGSRYSFINQNGSGITKIIKNIQILRWWKHNSKREIDILQNCKFIIGRTLWDKSVSKLLAPDSFYFYCSEVLRQPFYNTSDWQPHVHKKIIISSVLSEASYKGLDLVLKSANILMKYTKLEFEWNIFGVNDCFFAEKQTGLKAKNIHVILKGIVTAEALISELYDSDLFVHTSYIENSPNSICEAQMIGIPIIATNVGGVSSLIEDNLSGILVPANDPYYMATQIIRIACDHELSMKMGANERKIAKSRHNPASILKDLIVVYDSVLNLK
ncbi:glycosyltransferase family 4 protein [Microbacter margulisiae]|uniref:Glycosyltransferase involved in cell wall biosynthesis n=1 Tax=Microbacter margulisiae TaxID=1350067 RepID=A0A7W5H298_9PORP|nr:glycosyltransferase [Microbacter margulisiae]MBB3187202.1 glycosyltransferase involved in cell wall biosynthesis [Microbacter margulisiae]